MTLRLPGTEIAKNDINRLFAASVAGALSTAVLYTIFGLIFCRAHAGRIAMEMALLAANSMTPVIKPDDVHLTSFWHQLGSGSFFGMTLGLLVGIAGSAAGAVMWFTAGMVGKLSKALFFALIVIVDAFAVFSGFSRELPAVSIIFGLLSSAAFFLPWLLIVRNTKAKEVPKLSWLIFAMILFAPLVLLKSQSYELIRDSMVDMPFLSTINRFYYDHTLLAADVIKPLNYRTQNAVAVPESFGEITGIPHGTLIVRTADPCAVKGAVLAVSTHTLSCDSAQVSGGTASLPAETILKNKAGDPNKLLRNGIGTFLKGPILIVPLVWLGWASLGLSLLFRKSRIAAIVLTIIYAATFIPAFYHTHLKSALNLNPSIIHEYAASENEAKRYLTLIYMLDENSAHTDGLYPDELKALSGDKRASTRLNSMILAGKLKDPRFIDIVRTSLDDAQVNVRTKAVSALAMIAGKDSVPLLKGVLHNDPSWYVRDYAYNSMSKTNPETMVVTQ